MRKHKTKAISLKIRHVKVGELETYVRSSEYAHTSVIPITPQRVASHIRNPRAEKEDTALILAEEEGGNVLGFIGLLPDYIFEPQQKKVYWISCWWAHPEKGHSLGIAMLLAAYKASNGLLLADASPDTLAIFQKSRMFHVPKPKAGLKIFIKPLLKDVVIRKRPNWVKYKKLLGFVDNLIFWSFLPIGLLQRALNPLPKGVEVKHVQALDVKHSEPNYFLRNSTEFGWITQFPWVLESNVYQEKRHYPFSTFAKRFQNHFLELSFNGLKIASLFMTEREGVFKLHYIFGIGGYESIISRTILNFLTKQNAKEFTTFDDGLLKAFSAKAPLFYKRPTTYQYVFGKGFVAPLDIHSFQYGDGDAVFT